MSSVFTRRLDERPELYLNHELQPVSDDSKIRAEFSSFLGKLSRECVPLDYVNWKQIPDEEKNSWWEFIKVKMTHLLLVQLFTFSTFKVGYFKYSTTNSIQALQPWFQGEVSHYLCRDFMSTFFDFLNGIRSTSLWCFPS